MFAVAVHRFYWIEFYFCRCLC